MDIEAKVFLNNANKQLVIHLSKKKLQILKEKIPKLIRMKGVELEY